MRVAVLTSGSKANSTYVECAGRGILIDCGLSAKQTCIRMEALGIDINKLEAVIVTHEHGDHIRGVPVISRKLKIPVYSNLMPYHKFADNYANEHFSTGYDFSVAGFDIHPFAVAHDASDPVGFAVKSNGYKYAHVTDLGRITRVVREAVKDANFLLLESNYDQTMLQDCAYPWELKQRIASSHGHLSNADAAMFLADITTPDLQHVVLGHLSENSNTPELALKSAEKVNDLESFKSFQCGSIERSTPILEL